MKIDVYVDGFNLYYGCLKGTPYRWLDLQRLSELLPPHDEIHRIRYFTARISARSNDPGDRHQRLGSAEPLNLARKRYGLRKGRHPERAA